MLSHLRALLTHVPAPILIVGAALSAYSGAAFAVMIFSVLEPGVIAWLRVFIAGIFLCIWRRPWKAGLRWRDLLESALFGLSLMAMNVAFYESIDFLPMGAAVCRPRPRNCSTNCCRFGDGWGSCYRRLRTGSF